MMLAAGDTFRAAAREQLIAWGERNNVVVIAQEQGDSAAVIFDAVHSAKARGIDVVLADTALFSANAGLALHTTSTACRHLNGLARSKRLTAPRTSTFPDNTADSVR